MSLDNSHNGSQKVIDQALATIASVIQLADKQSNFPISLNKVFICSTNSNTQYLLDEIWDKITDWLNAYILKPENGVTNKTVFLAYLSDDNKQIIKEEIRTSEGLKSRIGKGLIIPLDQYGQLIGKEEFAELIYS